MSPDQTENERLKAEFKAMLTTPEGRKKFQAMTDELVSQVREKLSALQPIKAKLAVPETQAPDPIDLDSLFILDKKLGSPKRDSSVQKPEDVDRNTTQAPTPSGAEPFTPDFGVKTTVPDVVTSPQPAKNAASSLKPKKESLLVRSMKTPEEKTDTTKPVPPNSKGKVDRMIKEDLKKGGKGILLDKTTSGKNIDAVELEKRFKERQSKLKDYLDKDKGSVS